MSLAPIVLFVYNRLLHTQKTIEALLCNELADQSELFIFSDGPRTIADNEKVEIVRSYLKNINGFKKVLIFESKENNGLANSIINGVTNIINKYTKIIVLEDDLVTAPGFLKYMNTALNRYEKEEKVLQISGFMFPINVGLKRDAFFLPLSTSWGWGSWKRAWNLFDPGAKNYERVIKERELKRQFNLNNSYSYSNMLIRQISGRIDSWAIRYWLSFFLAKGLCLYPKKSLVINIGFDGSGTHCKTSLKDQLLNEKSLNEQTENIIFPEKIDYDKKIYDNVCKYNKSSIMYRFAKSFIYRFDKMIGKMLQGKNAIN